jgi:hypothetical protein
MSTPPSNSGSDAIIYGTAAAAAVGIGAVIAGAAFGPVFLVFGTMFFQGLSSSLKLQGDINAEIERQQGICDELNFTQQKLDIINATYDLLKADQVVEDSIVQQIGEMSDTITAEMNKIRQLKTNFRKNLFIQVVMYAAIVTIMIFIIMNKHSS